MYLLVIFSHFGINVVALFIYDIDLMMQIFAESLQTERYIIFFLTFNHNPAILWRVAHVYVFLCVDATHLRVSPNQRWSPIVFYYYCVDCYTHISGYLLCIECETILCLIVCIITAGPLF